MIRVLTATLVAGISLATPARAALITTDSSFGSGTLIHDTATGLHWLNPQVTQGR